VRWKPSPPDEALTSDIRRNMASSRPRPTYEYSSSLFAQCSSFPVPGAIDGCEFPFFWLTVNPLPVESDGGFPSGHAKIAEPLLAPLFFPARRHREEQLFSVLARVRTRPFLRVVDQYSPKRIAVRICCLSPLLIQNSLRLAFSGWAKRVGGVEVSFFLPRRRGTWGVAVSKAFRPSWSSLLLRVDS